MKKAFSLLSWNIEHFRDSPARVERVAGYLNRWKPDVFGLYEIEGSEIFNMMYHHFPQYSMFITEGQQAQEILVACRKTFAAITFQQKHEFQSGNPALRPGALLSFERFGVLYGVLFLHTDSGTDAVAFGNRAEIFRHAFNLKRTLDKKYGNAALIIVGDMNTMGLQYPRQRKAETKVGPDMEVFNLMEEATKVQMSLLEKEEEYSWMGSRGKSNLDHIIAGTRLKFRTFTNGKKFAVRVDGWNTLTDKAERQNYLDTISDHCLLYCEIMR